jgi:phosphoglycolate phosphatase
MAAAFEEVFGIPDGFAGVSMGGRTDAWILAQAAAAHHVTHASEQLAQFRDVYLSRLSTEVHQPGPRKGVMPGVRPLLDTLAARDDVILALLTGNAEHGARVKLEHFDLWRYFTCGAFGDDVVERNALLPLAVARVAACGAPAPTSVVVIGDTPFDVEVAREGRARSVAVATGSHDVDALRATGADAVLPDFSDLAATLAALGLEKGPPRR